MNFDNNDSVDVENSMTNVALATMILSDNDSNSYNEKSRVSSINFNTDLGRNNKDIFHYYIERIVKISTTTVTICLCLYVVRTFFKTNDPIEFALQIFPTLGYSFLYMFIGFGALLILAIIASIFFQMFKNN
jgi:hypothetical protein